MAWHPFRNLGLKVVAVVLGTLLWFTVSGQQAERTIPDVAVVYRNKPDSFEITNQTSLVSVYVKGMDTQLRGLLPRDFDVRVDLSGAHEGSQTIDLRTDQVTTPSGLQVIRIDPPTVTAVLEAAGSASLPVRPFVDGTPAQGFVISEIKVVPPTVTVIGPARRVAAATAATTDRVSIEGAKAPVNMDVKIGVQDATLRLRESKTAAVTVLIERAGERLFAAQRVAIRNAGVGLRATVEPAVVSVLIRGAETLLARLEPRTLVAYVDVANLPRGQYEVPVLIDLGGTLTVASVRPATVTVTIN